MKDFFKNPEKASFRISPDGKYISYRAPWKNRMNIFVQKVGETSRDPSNARHHPRCRWLLLERRSHPVQPRHQRR